MQSFEDVLREFEDFLQTASYLEVLPCRWGYVRLFNEGAPINFYAVLCRTPTRTIWYARKWSCHWKRGSKSTTRLITRNLLCNSFAFHVILLNDLLEYCVFRQKNAREKRNVHSVSLGVFVLFWKFCQMDCEWPCGIQQRFLHFWRTSKINRF